MSLADNFSITVHAKNATKGGEYTPYVLEYTNIGGRVALSSDDEDAPKSRIDLKHYFSKEGVAKLSGDNNSAAGTTVNCALRVKESLEEIQTLIDNAQIEHIKKLQKLRINVL